MLPLGAPNQKEEKVECSLIIEENIKIVQINCRFYSSFIGIK
jgi:hypothetical protein